MGDPPHGLEDTCGYAARPPPTEPVQVARWLMARASWGVIATTSAARGGHAWANVVSMSDNCSGIPMFYLSKMDETARDLASQPRATFTVAEAQLASQCVGTDPEDPRCAKVSLHGEIVRAPDQRAAQEVLFRKHPAMRLWPPGHGFEAYVAKLLDVFVLSDYGGAKPISVSEYLRARVEMRV